ncbi:hypothetical protein RN001_003558 [Aquatica leii]|uniref:SCAN domain-containing protein n=1 Tax=Aquatica leii TaxID=1421715 RepID=A0AAN7Q9N4_9COLE|nr:hypothetical protein RN001_003558 [Aquatica leii]
MDSSKWEEECEKNMEYEDRAIAAITRLERFAAKQDSNHQPSSPAGPIDQSISVCRNTATNKMTDLEQLADTPLIVSNEAEDSQNLINSQHSTQEITKEHGNETQTEEYGNETRQETLPSIDLACIVCFKETSGAHTSYKCNNNVHATCDVTEAIEGFGSKLVCSICVNQINQENQRNSAKESLREQAKQMQALSDANHPVANEGATVRIKIPDVDRAQFWQ